MPTDPLLITRWLYTEALWSARGIKNLSNMVPSLFQDKTDPPSHCWVGVPSDGPRVLRGKWHGAVGRMTGYAIKGKQVRIRVHCSTA